MTKAGDYPLRPQNQETAVGRTREGEEKPLLTAFSRHAPPEALLVLVPRHPQRFNEVAARIAGQHLSYARRSAGLRIAPDTCVWLGDSMGEMVAYYSMADVAIIGGSWQPLGGQNLIEACAAGAPVLGPHTFNFTEAAAKAIEAGAARRCSNLNEALHLCAAMLADSTMQQAMSRAGQGFAASSRGATARTVQTITTVLNA